MASKTKKSAMSKKHIDEEMLSYKANPNWFIENRFVIITFFLTAIIMLVTYILRDIYPFGDKIILKVDLYHQYAPFHEELRERIFAGKSLLYSWEGGLGKEFITQLAYYTCSPISILILLFPQEKLPEALALFILLKTAFSGAFFAYYLKASFKRNNISIIAFGILYAFTAFMVGFYWNVMWLDAVALFPIVALGIERIIDQNKHMTYLVSLALVIIINFYIAFIVCVFSVLYFLVVLFSKYKLSRDYKVMFQKALKFGIISALAGGISMALTIPTAIALGQTETSSTGFPRFEFYQNVWQLITNHFLGARLTVLARNEDLPNIYSGIITVVLLPLYFFNSKIDRKEKILNSAILVFMLLCACVKPLDYLIHGCHFPSNLPHRYTFIYSFILIKIAYKGFINIKSSEMTTLLFTVPLYIIIILFTEFVLAPNISDIDRVLSNSDIIINIIGMIIYIGVLYLYYNSNKEDLGAVFSIVLVLCIAECIFSSHQGLDRTTSRDDYCKYIESTDQAVEFLDQRENGGFYRTEFRRFTTINDAALYHYNGFSQFSSLAPGGICKFIGSLGIASTGNSFRYYDPTSLVDALFNLKYVMNKAPDGDNGEIKNQRYTYLTKFGNCWIYENDRVLPLGFMTDGNIKDWNTEDSMPFDVQNEFIKKAAGIDKDMFTAVPLTTLNKTYMETSEEINDNEFKYKLTDPANLDLRPTVSATIVSDKEQYIYLYVDAGNAKRVKFNNLSINEDRELSAGKSLFDIGKVSAGETINVSFELTNIGEFEKTYRKDGTVKLYAAAYDDSVFQEAFDKLSKSPYEITSFDDTRIEGTITAQNDGVMFTSIPYIPGWKVTVDGTEAENVSIGNDGVIGVDVSQGTHTIVFSYSPAGLKIGCCVSLASLVLAVVYCLYCKKKEGSIKAA